MPKTVPMNSRVQIFPIVLPAGIHGIEKRELAGKNVDDDNICLQKMMEVAAFYLIPSVYIIFTIAYFLTYPML